MNEIFYILNISNFGPSYLIEFQPKASTSKAYEQSKGEETRKFEAHADNHDIPREEDSDISDWETNFETQDDGKELNRKKKHFQFI